MRKFARSPLRYPGGKSRAAEKIAALAPTFSEYREPFVGGGSIFIRLRQQSADEQFWINDKYSELAAFWRELQNQPENLIAQIEMWKREFDDGKKLHRFLQTNLANFNRLETAAAFFVFNRITFSGTTEAGGFSEQAFQKRFTESSIERLKDLPAVLRGVRITDFDYEAVISEPGETVFLFLDPPYFSATDSALYGKNGSLHKSFDHRRFARVLQNCQHKWLLTYDDSTFVRELFSFANVTSWKLMYGMRNVTAASKQLGDELLISNYEFSLSISPEDQKSFIL